MRHFRDITKDELQEEIAAAMSPEDQDRATDYFEGATPVDEVTEPEPQVDKSAETAAPSQGAPAHAAPAAPLRRLIARRAPELNAGKPAPLALHSAAPTPLLGQSADVDAASEHPLVEGIVPIQTVTPEVDPNVTQTLEALPHAMVDLRHVYKSFGEGDLAVHVLHDIQMCVMPGEYVAIMGPSGSGKTTLMNIIGCLDVPTSGTYLLDGEDVSGLDDRGLSSLRNRKLGFVFQNFNLLPRETAVENVALPLLYAGVSRAERLERAAEALRSVGLGDRLDFLPTQLSGGQSQRVAIARAMVGHPELLLADEPTGALDSASGEQIMQIFDDLNAAGVTIVMITHESEVAEHAHRTMSILDGRLGFVGGEQ